MYYITWFYAAKNMFRWLLSLKDLPLQIKFLRAIKTFVDKIQSSQLYLHYLKPMIYNYKQKNTSTIFLHNKSQYFPKWRNIRCSNLRSYICNLACTQQVLWLTRSVSGLYPISSIILGISSIISIIISIIPIVASAVAIHIRPRIFVVWISTTNSCGIRWILRVDTRLKC